MRGKVVLVTGASRGIGAAIAEALAVPGVVIGVNYLASKSQAEAVKRRVEAKGAKAELLHADVTRPEAVDAMVGTLERRHGAVSTLSLNAGVPFKYARVHEISPAEFEAQWRVLAHGSFLCVRRVASGMAKARSGDIVFVLSEAVKDAPPGYMAAYASAKYAALGLAKALSSELAGKGVRIHTLFPPMTETDFIKDFPRPVIDAARDAKPERRLAKPDEIAAQVLSALDSAERVS